jgi:hypothetical protein
MFAPAAARRDAETSTPAATAGVGATLQAFDVKDKAGLFFSEANGQPLRLGVDNGRLRIAGGPALEAVTADRFRNPRGALSVMSQDEFELRFVAPDLVELQSMEGRTTRFRRARRYTPTTEDLQGFVGRYSNDENRTVFDITAASGGLAVRVSWNHAQPFEFRPVDRDTFQLAGMIVRFRRDTAGKIVGLAYSNPVVRNIEFTRACECAGGPLTVEAGRSRMEAGKSRGRSRG